MRAILLYCMEFFIYSRHGMEAAKPHDVPHIIISITSALGDVARFRTNDQTRGVIRFAFPDAIDSSEMYSESDLFSLAHASQVWDFVLLHRRDVQRVVLHCDAGVSRAPAVAAALARALGYENAEFFSGKYRPNKRVYELLLATAPKLSR